MKAVLRRANGTVPTAASAVLRAGDLELDLIAHEVRCAGEPLALTTKEFDLLAHFLRHPNRAFRRGAAAVWGWTYGDTATVTVHVRRLREKVELDPSDPRHLRTGVGRGLPLRAMRRILLPLAVGGVLAFALCVLLGGTVADALGLVALASGAALVAALAGFAILQRMGEAPVGRQAVVVSLVAVGATAIGAAAASWAMFLSEHDLDALAVVLVAAGSVGVGAAIELGHRVAAGSRSWASWPSASATTRRATAPSATVRPATRRPRTQVRSLRADPPAEELASMAQRLDEAPASGTRSRPDGS